MAEEVDSFDDDASLRRVEEGGLPALAERRLAEVRQGDGAFTSDLSVADFALCHQLGLTPLSQVMGTSIYQVGYQTTGYGYGRGVAAGYGGAGERGELRVISRAWNDARERAFSRLAQEAAAVGANAVVGVEVRSGVANWTETGGNGAIEYVVTGTAVRREDSRARGTVLTELSVSDYAKLLAAGVEPVGIVAWTAVHFVSLVYFQVEREERGIGAFGGGALGGGSLGGGSFRNFEYKRATQTFYDARESVMEKLNGQARRLGASGIVGVRIGHTIRGAGGDGAAQSAGLIASFSALGTAVHDVDAAPQAPQTTIDLST
jgi:uncharacterized protein YbjQ (UPF0145 family)